MNCKYNWKRIRTKQNDNIFYSIVKKNKQFFIVTFNIGSDKIKGIFKTQNKIFDYLLTGMTGI